jgi:L-asparaginase II
MSCTFNRWVTRVLSSSTHAAIDRSNRSQCVRDRSSRADRTRTCRYRSVSTGSTGRACRAVRAVQSVSVVTSSTRDTVGLPTAALVLTSGAQCTRRDGVRRCPPCCTRGARRCSTRSQCVRERSSRADRTRTCRYRSVSTGSTGRACRAVRAVQSVSVVTSSTRDAVGLPTAALVLTSGAQCTRRDGVRRCPPCCTRAACDSTAGTQRIRVRSVRTRLTRCS